MSSTLSATYHAIAQAAAKDDSFVNFDLQLDPDSLADFKCLRVAQDDTYDNFGQTDSVLDDTARFLESIGNDPALSRRVAETIDGLVKDALSAVNAETAWFTIRASTPNDLFDVARWHTDGKFFDPAAGTDQRKIAMTLKGPGTLLNALPANLRETFNTVARSFARDSLENRKEVEKLIDPAHTESSSVGRGLIFVVGNDERSAVHSEPPIHTERLFISMVPGTHAQIAELRARWGAPHTSYKPATLPQTDAITP